MRYSRAAPRADICVKIAAVLRWLYETCANDEVAEMLAGLALAGIGGKQRIEARDDCGMIDILGIELGKARAVERRAEIKIVAAWTFSDEADLCEIRPRAAVRAAGYANDDVVGREAMCREPRIQRIEQGMGRGIRSNWRQRLLCG